VSPQGCRSASLSVKPNREIIPKSDDGARLQTPPRERNLSVVEGNPKSPEPPRASAPSQRSLRGLDWFVFFVADVQTGFGPFVSVYLTTQKWTQIDIGLVLTVAGLVALAGQIPGGMLVDAARSERLVAGIAVTAIALSALTYAAFPIFPAILTAAVVQATASCVLGPAIAAISLGLVSHAGIGERLGRNARFASIGNGFAAALMGACGYFFSPRAVFIVTGLLLIPTVLALRHIASHEINPQQAHGGPSEPDRAATPFRALLRHRSLLVLACCVGLFHLANAAMLPLMASALTNRLPDWATVLIAVCIVVPQLVVALIAPWIGRQAQIRGRRPLLILGFAALAIRGLLFATFIDPAMIVVIQLLDGVSAAVLGVMVPLIVADITRDTGRFNSSLGVVGMVSGGGAAMSMTLAGTMTDFVGSQFAFLGLGAIAIIAVIAAMLLIPETRPER
jgi:predicted MFS family arabinose efflux permease